MRHVITCYKPYHVARNMRVKEHIYSPVSCTTSTVGFSDKILVYVTLKECTLLCMKYYCDIVAIIIFTISIQTFFGRVYITIYSNSSGLRFLYCSKAHLANIRCKIGTCALGLIVTPISAVTFKYSILLYYFLQAQTPDHVFQGLNLF